MTPPRADARAAPAAGELLAALTTLLTAQLEVQRALLESTARKRAALRGADGAALVVIAEEEAGVVNRLEQLEGHRRELVTALAPALGLAADPRPTLAAIAGAAGPPHDAALRAVIEPLRETATVLRRESSVLRASADALRRHLDGIARSVHGALGRACVYGRGGELDGGAPVRFSVDMRT